METQRPQRWAVKRVRAWLFLLLTILSLVWCSTLCVFLFKFYDQTDAAQRNVVGVLVFVEAVTSIMLPALLIIDFRPWLDAARIAFLIIAHVGPALLITILNSTFHCPTDPSQHKRCKNIGVAILACSWIIPVLLIGYSILLLVKYVIAQEDEEKRSIPDPSSEPKDPSELPMQSRPVSLGPLNNSLYGRISRSVSQHFYRSWEGTRTQKQFVRRPYDAPRGDRKRSPENFPSMPPPMPALPMSAPPMPPAMPAPTMPAPTMPASTVGLLSPIALSPLEIPQHSLSRPQAESSAVTDTSPTATAIIEAYGGYTAFYDPSPPHLPTQRQTDGDASVYSVNDDDPSPLTVPPRESQSLRNGGTRV